jgi:hypothetical protein
MSNWNYASNTAFWTSNRLSNYATSNYMSNWNYASNTAFWTSNRLSNYATSNYMSNWNYASNTAFWTSNRLSNYATSNYMSNWNFASNTAFWTSNRLSNYAPISTVNIANYASNLATWLSNQKDYWVYPAGKNYTYTFCNVAIGNSNPLYDLDVTGITRSTTLMASGIDSISAAGTYIQWSSRISAANGGTGLSYYLNQPGTGSTGGHSFGTVTSANVYTEWMRLSKNNIFPQTSITNGTTSLLVQGDIMAASNIFAARGVYCPENAVGATQTIFSIGYNAAATGTIRSGDTEVFSQDASATLKGAKMYVHGADAPSSRSGYFTFYNGTRESMRILPHGTVLIGKTWSDADTNLLEVNSDNVLKPTAGGWNGFSDIRLKEEIVEADLDLCYTNVKSIPLKFYKLKDKYFTSHMARDRHKLGWIAQEVEQFFPKAVNADGTYADVENVMTLNTDQIYAAMYGAIQRMQQIIESQDQRIEALERQIG